MRRASFIVLTALGLALSCAAPAFAEKWRWFAIRGGAVAYDEESFKSDIKSNTIAANTLVYYEKPRTAGGQPYVFQAERAWFECLGARYRWSQSSVLDQAGGVIVSRPDGLWTPLAEDKGSAALFQRMLCLNQYPPGGREAPSFEALLKAVQTAPAASKAPEVKAAAAPQAKAPDPKAPEAKAPDPKAAAPTPKAADAKAAAPAKPLDLDTLANSLLKTSKSAAKTTAPAAKTAAPAAKTAKPAAPVAKPAPPKVEPKLRPTTAP